MTAPDHRPYLLATDLRTAEDVATWLREHAEQWRRDAVADPSVGARSVRLDYAGLRAIQGAHADLLARLDRERRQACRRATRAWAFLARMHRRNADMYAKNDDHDEAMSCRAARGNSLQAALAFRAAARQP